MVTLDIARLSHGEIEETITYHCRRFGGVLNIRVMPPDKTREYAIAMVTMSNEAEAAEVAARIGDMHSGKCAVIQLQQEARPIPASLLRAANSDSGLSST